MIFVGLDLHKRYITACALDAVGQLLAEERRLATDLAMLLGWLGRLTGPVTVVLEATLYWAWLEQQLTAAGYTVQVAHPYQVKLIWHARTKTDPIDIHAYLTGENLRSPAVDLYGRAERAWLATVVLPPGVRRYVDLLLANLDLLTTQILALDKYLQRHVRQDAVAQRLQTIPGVGPFGALLLQAEIGPITRFRSAQELAAYAGLVPSTHSSGGKTQHGHVGRGSPWLKWILIEILQTLKLAPGPVGSHYQRLLRAKGKPKATVAAARKFCTYLYWILKEEWSYTEWLRQHDHPEVRPVQPLGSVA